MNIQSVSNQISDNFKKPDFKINHRENLALVKEKRPGGKHIPAEGRYQPYLRYSNEIFLDNSPNLFSQFNSHHILCIEFGPSELKLMRMIKNKGKYHVEKNEVINFQKSTYSSEIINDTIRQYHSACKSSKTNVVLVLSGPDILVKTFKLPLMKKEQIREAVYWKLKQEIPSFSEKDLWDYNKTGVIIESDKKWLNIITVIAKEKFIEKYVNILKHLSISPQKIIVKPVAFSFALKALTYNRVYSDKSVAVIEFEQDYTLLCFFRNGVLEFTKNIPVGSVDIDRELLKPLKFKDRTINIKPGKTDLFKQKYGIVKDLLKHPENPVFPYSQLNNFMRPVLNELVYDIKRALIFYQHSYFRSKIQTAFLTGKGAYLKNLNSYLANETGLTVYPMDLSFRDMESRKINKWKEYTACFGAGCHQREKFNFVPGSIKDEKKFSYWRKVLFVISLFVFSMLSFSSVILTDACKNQEKILAKERNRYLELSEGSKKYAWLLSRKEKLGYYKIGLTKQLKNEPEIIKILKTLSYYIPNDIQLNSLSFHKVGTAGTYNSNDEDEGIVKVSGTVFGDFSTSDITLVQFISVLQNINYYKKIDLVNKKRDDNHHHILFKLNLVLP